MNPNDDPFEPSVRLDGCSCGRHASQAAHDAQGARPMDAGKVEQVTRRAL